MFDTVPDGIDEAKSHLSNYCNNIEFVEIPCENSIFDKKLLAIKSIFTIDPYTINWLKSIEMRKLIERMVKTNQYDVVHFDSISLSSYIPCFPDKPKVLDHHNIESHMMLRRASQEDNYLKKIYYLVEGKKLLGYEKSICSKYDMHITCSSIDSARLLDVDDQLKVEEIPNGVDVEYFYPVPNNELNNHLVFAGGLDWYPNADAMSYFANEIWPLLRHKVPDIVMNVIGKNPSSELTAQAKQDSNFRVHGFVDDVRKYLSEASVYICPIRDGGGTKLKLLDAFAMGKATIAHPIASEGIEVVDGHNVVLADTPADFAEKAIHLLNNKALREKLGRNARQLVTEKYAFNKIGEKLSGLYSRI
jgi:glycosyltransferase involved in cell wall biosynthesis